MREKGQTEVAKTLETPVFSRGIEILTEKYKLYIILVEQKALETVPSVTFYTRRKSHERPVLRRIASCRQPLRKPY